MLFGTMEVKEKELWIGGISASELLKEHGSPLYVYDQTLVESMIDEYQSSFQSTLFETRVAYASKAFLTTRMIKLLSEKNMSLDCVSSGEMITAYKAGFDMSKTIIHGNNKSNEELALCFDLGVGYVVVDNVMELADLIELANQKQQKIKTLLRVNPGVEAHTHEYIVTAKLTSKFGESIFDESILNQIFELYHQSSFVEFSGFHCHIGSQVFDSDAFVKTIDVMTSFIKTVNETYHVTTKTLNLGGGFGVYYVEEDTPQKVSVLSRTLIRSLETALSDKGVQLEEVMIEPGRSIVSNAGVTLYTIGYQKKTFGGKDYVFVDGGMSDNIRPALYQAKYSCDVATNMTGVKEGTWTVAGKLCESGDVLIEQAALQPFQKGDILAVYSTGAYNYSMASNYNRILKPAVVFVKNGTSEVVVKRETYEDLLRNDV